jgi:hypothetical protein
MVRITDYADYRRRHDIDPDPTDQTLRDSQRYRVPMFAMDAATMNLNRAGFRMADLQSGESETDKAYREVETRDENAWRKTSSRDDNGPNGFGSVAFKGGPVGAPCMTASGEAGTVEVDDDGYLFCRAVDPSPAAGPEPRIDSRDGETATEREYRLLDEQIARDYEACRTNK